MPKIRLFEKPGEQVRVWFVETEGDGTRELRDPIGHLPGDIDWRATAESCRPLGDEGLEIELVFRPDGDGA